MAYLCELQYPASAGKTSDPSGRIVIALDPGETDRIAALTLSLYRPDGRVARRTRLTALATEGGDPADGIRLIWRGPMRDPDGIPLAVALTEAAGRVLSFVSYAPLLAVDGPAAGARATVLPPEAGDRPGFGPDGSLLTSPVDAPTPPLCLAGGTRVDTATGPRAVESLRAGDRIVTLSGAQVPLRLVLAHRVEPSKMRRDRRFWPVCIRAGALGFGLPRRTLWVGAQHRMLYQSIRVPLLFGDDAVLVRAKSMAASLDRIYVDASAKALTYFQLVFDRHEVIFAEGAATESFLPAAEDLQHLAPQDRARLRASCPHLGTGTPGGELGFPTLRSWELMACVA